MSQKAYPLSLWSQNSLTDAHTLFVITLRATAFICDHKPQIISRLCHICSAILGWAYISIMSDRRLSLTLSKTFNLFSFVFKHLAESLIKVVQSLNYRIAILDQINQIGYIGRQIETNRKHRRSSKCFSSTFDGSVRCPSKLERTD